MYALNNVWAAVCNNKIPYKFSYNSQRIVRKSEGPFTSSKISTSTTDVNRGHSQRDTLSGYN